jgi:exopolysaccharide biosynthesis protein/flagellar hook assembly protein FlgD
MLRRGFSYRGCGSMPRKLFAVAVAGLVLAAPAGARPLQVMPGVTYDHTVQWTPHGPLSLYVITAPKPGGLYGLNALLSNGTITGRETVASMERDVSAHETTIGVNGDFFNWNGGWPSGLLMQGGVVEHHPATNRAAVGIDASGTLHVDRVPWIASWRGVSTTGHPIAELNEPPRNNRFALFTPVWGPATPAVKGLAAVLEPFPPTVPYKDLTAGVTSYTSDTSVPIPRDGAVLVARGSAVADLQADAPVGGQITVRIALMPSWASVLDAVSGGPTLVESGVPIANAHEALTPIQLNGRDPRTAIGQRADGSIVMVAADGREPGWSVGISNWDLAQTLIRFGCVTGFALDSGGSTTVALDGQLLNRPSDPTGQRPVAEALVIAYAGVYTPFPAPTISPNADGYADREFLTYKLVRPSSVTAQLIAPDGTTRVLDAESKAPGRYRISWDGKDASGAPAPEGAYRWTVNATDDLGRTSVAGRTFTLDNTLGFLHVERNARRITFTLTRDATIRVTIETRSGIVLRTIAKGPRTTGTITAMWNGRDGRGKRVPRGTYVVQVSAKSEIGTSAMRSVARIGR